MSASLRSSLAALACAFVWASPAQAVVIAGFEADLDGFTTTGDVYRVDTGFDASLPEGNWALFLSTFPNGAGLLGPLTGTPIDQTATPVVTASVLEAFFGLAAGALNAPLSPSGNDAIEGSGAQLDFTIASIQTLRFEFSLLTNETDAWAPDFRDYFFTTLTGQPITVQGDVFASPLVASATIFDRETGWGVVEWLDLPAGTYTLGVGLVDVEDSDLGTAVLFDNIQLIPEPRAALLTSLGLAGMWLLGRPRPR